MPEKEKILSLISTMLDGCNAITDAIIDVDNEGNHAYDAELNKLTIHLIQLNDIAATLLNKLKK